MPQRLARVLGSAKGLGTAGSRFRVIWRQCGSDPRSHLLPAKCPGSEAVHSETPAGSTDGQLGSPPACRLPAITLQLISGVQLGSFCFKRMLARPPIFQHCDFAEEAPGISSPSLLGFELVPSSQETIRVQFSSVAQSYLTLCDPMDCSTPGSPARHQLLELAQTHVHRVGDAIQPSHPLSSPSPYGDRKP